MTDRIDIVMGMMARCDWLTAGDARFIIDNGIDFDAVLRFVGLCSGRVYLAPIQKTRP